MKDSRLVNRNVVAGRGRTSMRMEPELWDALLEICQRVGPEMEWVDNTAVSFQRVIRTTQYNDTARCQ